MKINNQSILHRMLVILSVVIGLVILIWVGRLLSLGLSIPGYANYWKTQNQKPAPSDALVYLALGDSTAQGIGASRPVNGYVGLVAKRLEQKSGRPVKIINLSKSGAKVSDCLKEQIPEIMNYQPDVITIEIGANDLSIWNEAEFRRDMAELISKLPAKTVISDMPYFGGGRRKNLEPLSVTASAIIRELASKRGLKLAPLHEVTAENDHWTVNGADLFHPSNKGYRNWYKAFAEPLGLL